MPKNETKFGATPRAHRISDDAKSAEHNRRINAIHPGPSADFAFPTPEPETKPERLSRLERELVDRKCAKDRPSNLAIQILVLRAEING